MAKPVVTLAGGCAPPHPAGLERRMGERLRVAHVDVNDDSGEALARKYAVRGVPAFILLDGRGNVVYRKLGGRPDVEAIEQRVSASEAAR